MRDIIKDKVYDTETAEKVGEAGRADDDRGTGKWWVETLYRTKKGNWFTVGSGGAASPYASESGEGGTEFVFHALSHDEAKNWCLTYCNANDEVIAALVMHFGIEFA